MSYMFSCCKSLNNLPDISKQDTKYVNDMSYMFRCCKSLNNLPDISKQDTKYVMNMKHIFYNCNNKIIPRRFRNK